MSAQETRPPRTDPRPEELPLAQRPVEDVPGHWLLARLGKRVLRPGSAALTTAMLRAAQLEDADVVEFAPGLGRTAREIIAAHPRSYVGVDQDPQAAAIVEKAVAPTGRVVHAGAASTGLEADSADVVVGEAMLTMQTDRGKAEIIAEAVRLLRPGGRYAIHELGLAPDHLAEARKTEIRQDLARSIKVNARPLTLAEWARLLQDAGLEVQWSRTAPMALLQLRRNLADEGLLGVARIARNLLRDPRARRRVMGMRASFRRSRRELIGVAMVARRR